MGRFVLLSRICRPFGARKFLNSTSPGRAPGATIFRPLRGLAERYLPKSPRWRAVLMLSAAFVSLSGSPWKRIASDPSVNEITGAYWVKCVPTRPSDAALDDNAGHCGKIAYVREW